MDQHRLTPDFRDFFETLHAHRVDYLLVGGYAVGLHGYVRHTSDIDIWVGVDAENAERLIKAVQDFAGDSETLSAEKFTRPSYFLFIGIEPNRLDLITTIPGVDFARCRSQAVTMQLDDIEVQVIDRESLIRNKRASGRPKDLIDAEALEEI
jgi:hypothetical protein